MSKRLFTSEAVSMGHPDKLADRISDTVLDRCLEADPTSRVACESLVTTGMAMIAGEITTKTRLDYQNVVRDAIREVGYTDDEWGINADTCAVLVSLDRQSPDIAQGVDEAEQKDIGAGDQGLVFGYACNQTPEYMPLPIALAHRITNLLTEARFDKKVDWLRPDSKSQVTVEYEGNVPVRIDTVVLSTQHAPSIDQQGIREWAIPNIINPCLPQDLNKGDIKYFVNPTGKFVVGGPHGDCGLTGRKIIVDTYGGWARHGGGAFSGKDATKVDRSAAYMARYIAKNVVAAGLAESCEIQIAYAIGVSEPVSVLADLGGTGKVCENKLVEVIRDIFPLCPSGIINHLRLRRPIFAKTSSGGHFGRNDADFTWERLDKVEELKQAFK
ncbi:MAG: methionine adenosyltransferase [Thermoguttaceae bacterium]|nr:methionine adenosyltransferase [Thermoguttaceae bacterium]